MAAKQFKQVVNIALKQPDTDLLHIDNTHLYGCALPEFKPVFCTILEVAALIRWQCQYLFGGHDAAELDSMWHIAQKKFKIWDGE